MRALHDSSMRRVRWAAAAPFLILGIVFSSYFVRMPSLKLEFGLSDGQLGTLLMLMVVSGGVAMQLTGTLVARFGSSPILRITMVGLPMALLGIALADNVAQFAVVLLVFGAVNGLYDVAMNAHAVAAERALKRRIMNGSHAAWSIGAAIGSVLGGAALTAGLSLTQHLLLVVVVVAPLSVLAGRYLLPARADAEPNVGSTRKQRSERRADRSTLGSTTTLQPHATGRRRRVGWFAGWFAGWTPRLLLLGITGTVVMVTEVSVGNWSGIFLHDELGASLAAASLGYIGFAFFQASGRLIGDRLHERFGGASLTRWSGGIALVGLAVVVLSPLPAVAIAGFSLLGLGVSVLLPTVFSSAGHSGADSGSNAAAALSKMGTLTYSGLLVGPVVIGWSAEAFGLTATLAGLLVVLGATLSVGLRRI